MIDGEIPGEILHKDEHCAAFKDIDPQAPTHLLVVPIEPITRIAEASPQHQETLGRILLVAAELGKKHCPNGFRLVINNGSEGGEAVPHLHVHVLGGRQLSWPPG